MRITVFAKIDESRQRAEAIPFLMDGLADIGLKPVLINPAMTQYNDGSCNNIDLAIIWGLRGKQAQLFKECQDKCIPVLMCDWGYWERGCSLNPGETRRYQLSINQLNWIPPVPCPDDRAKAISLKAGKLKKKRGDYILFCGQNKGDPHHKCDVHEWAREQISLLKQLTDRPIIHRSHPWDKEPAISIDGVTNETPETRSLEEAINGAHCVVTHSSTCGFNALMQGVPVICDPSALYGEAAGHDLYSIDEPEWHDAQPVFNRIAYGQWTVEEFRELTPFRFACQFIPSPFVKYSRNPWDIGVTA